MHTTAVSASAPGEVRFRQLSAGRRCRRIIVALAGTLLLCAAAPPLRAQDDKVDLDQFRTDLATFFTQVSTLVSQLPDRPVSLASNAAFTQAWTLLRDQPQVLQIAVNSLTDEQLTELHDALSVVPNWRDLAPRALAAVQNVTTGGDGQTSYTTTRGFPQPNASGGNKAAPLHLAEPGRTFCDAVDDNPSVPGNNRALLVSCDVFKGLCLAANIATEAVPGCDDVELSNIFCAIACLVKAIIKGALAIVASVVCSTKDLDCMFASSDSYCADAIFYNGMQVMLDDRLDELASEKSVGLRADLAHWGWCKAPSFAACTAHYDCGLGEACVGAQCVTIHTCGTNGDCGADGVCVMDAYVTQSLHGKLQDRLDVPVTSRATEDSAGVRGGSATVGWCLASGDRSCATQQDCAVGEACVASSCVTVRSCDQNADCATALCKIDPFPTGSLHDKLNQRLDVELTTRASEDSVEGQRSGPEIERAMSVRTVIDRTNDVTVKRIQEKVRKLTQALAEQGAALRELQERSTRLAIEMDLRDKSPRQMPVVLFEMPESITTPSKSYCSEATLTRCASAQDCPPAVPAEICSANQCTRGCASDTDCIRGGTCSGGVCVECAGDADCPSGRSCIGGTCLSGASCTTDADCPELRPAETCVAQPGIAGLLPKTSRVAQDVVDMTRSSIGAVCGNDLFCSDYQGIGEAQTQVTRGNVDAGFHTIIPDDEPPVGPKKAYSHYRRGYRQAAIRYNGVYPTPTPGP